MMTEYLDIHSCYPIMIAEYLRIMTYLVMMTVSPNSNLCYNDNLVSWNYDLLYHNDEVASQNYDLSHNDDLKSMTYLNDYVLSWNFDFSS